MRKYYVDNIRWTTVLLVVLYHVIYMYNGITAGGAGPFCETQYQDALQYILYPWFMIILFIVSGMSARFYLEKHTIKEFIAGRTRKLLVPSTVGLFVFHWILGYFNMQFAGAFETIPDAIPQVVLYIIMTVSGIGVLWYIQMLWIFSIGLALVRKFETGKLYHICEKANPMMLVLVGIPVWGAAQILNTPVIAVYRFGIYGFCYLLGYFVFAHENVVEKLSRYCCILTAVAVLLGIGYVYCYFGENYAVKPVVNSPYSVAYGWIAVLAIFAVMKKWADGTCPFADWMSKKSFGLYIFHYLPLAAVAYYMKEYTQMPALPSYLITGTAAYAGGWLLYEAVARIPILRWCVLGIKKEKKNV